MQSVELARLVDMAIGTPEVGAVNFNALHTLLHAMLAQTKCATASVMLDTADKNILTTGKFSSIVAARTESGDDIPIAESTKPHDTSNAAIQPTVMNSPYHALERKVSRLTDELEKLTNLPSTNEVLKLSKEGGSDTSKPVQAMYQNIRLDKRVAANEDCIEKLAKFMEDLMAKFNKLRSSTNALKSQLDDEAVSKNAISWNALEAGLKGEADEQRKTPSSSTPVTESGSHEQTTKGKSSGARTPSTDEERRRSQSEGRPVSPKQKVSAAEKKASKKDADKDRKVSDLSPTEKNEDIEKAKDQKGDKKKPKDDDLKRDKKSSVTISDPPKSGPGSPVDRSKGTPTTKSSSLASQAGPTEDVLTMLKSLGEMSNEFKDMKDHLDDLDNMLGYGKDGKSGDQAEDGKSGKDGELRSPASLMALLNELQEKQNSMMDALGDDPADFLADVKATLQAYRREADELDVQTRLANLEGHVRHFVSLMLGESRSPGTLTPSSSPPPGLTLDVQVKRPRSSSLRAKGSQRDDDNRSVGSKESADSGRRSPSSPSRRRSVSRDRRKSYDDRPGSRTRKEEKEGESYRRADSPTIKLDDTDKKERRKSKKRDKDASRERLPKRTDGNDKESKDDRRSRRKDDDDDDAKERKSKDDRSHRSRRRDDDDDDAKDDDRKEKRGKRENDDDDGDDRRNKSKRRNDETDDNDDKKHKSKRRSRDEDDDDEETEQKGEKSRRGANEDKEVDDEKAERKKKPSTKKHDETARDVNERDEKKSKRSRKRDEHDSDEQERSPTHEQGSKDSEPRKSRKTDKEKKTSGETSADTDRVSQQGSDDDGSGRTSSGERVRSKETQEPREDTKSSRDNVAQRGPRQGKTVVLDEDVGASRSNVEVEDGQSAESSKERKPKTSVSDESRSSFASSESGGLDKRESFISSRSKASVASYIADRAQSEDRISTATEYERKSRRKDIHPAISASHDDDQQGNRDHAKAVRDMYRAKSIHYERPDVESRHTPKREGGGALITVGESINAKIRALHVRLCKLEDSMDDFSLAGGVIMTADDVTRLLNESDENSTKFQDVFDDLTMLKEVKADLDYVGTEIDTKADKRSLDEKVNNEIFADTCNQINNVIKDIFEKLSLQEDDLKSVLTKMTDDIDNKLDRSELNSLKNWLETRLKRLNDKITRPNDLEDEAAGIKKQLLHRFNCISCDRPLEIAPSGPIASIPFHAGLPFVKSPRPYTTFELDQIRQHQKGIPRAVLLEMEKQATAHRMGPNKRFDLKAFVVHFEDRKTIMKRLKGEDASIMPDPLDYYTMDRPCGGSHTVTNPRGRTTKNSNFISQVMSDQPGMVVMKPHPRDELEIVGTDGRVYHGRHDDDRRTPDAHIHDRPATLTEQVEQPITMEMGVGTNESFGNRESFVTQPAEGPAAS